MADNTSTHHKVRAGLATVLNAPGPEEHRDSAYYSNADASSKHNSAASGIGLNVYHPAHEKTPSPTTTNMVPLVSPSSHMSVASMVSPTSPGLNRFDRPQSLESGAFANPASAPDSRRESVDSRMNQGFGDLRLGNSPYASQNQSTTSIQNSLRHPRPGLDQLSAHRISNGYQPNIDRTPAASVDPNSKSVRTAPAITGPATSDIARAAEPTRGQAWAFPEADERTNTSFLDSRRSSITESIASSQFTAESRYPPGQRRLDESLGATEFHQRLAQASGEYPSLHHHSLQNKPLSDIANDETSSQGGTQPYSRTPELRISHKMAERKRRTEMKELFEQLRDMMPQERGSKASKWEILTKAIAEHQRLQDNCSKLSNFTHNMVRENDQLRAEVDRMKAQLQGASLPASHSASSAPAAPPSSEPYAQDPYNRSMRPELPPLRALNGNVPNGPESMAGVQYEAQQHRPNGYAPERFS